MSIATQRALPSFVQFWNFSAFLLPQQHVCD